MNTTYLFLCAFILRIDTDTNQAGPQNSTAQVQAAVRLRKNFTAERKLDGQSATLLL
jgi:hypothetical protein